MTQISTCNMELDYRKISAAVQRTRPGNYVALYEPGRPHDAVGLLLNMWMGVAGDMAPGTLNVMQRVSHGLIDWVVHGMQFDIPVNVHFNLSEHMFARQQTEAKRPQPPLVYWMFAPTIWFADYCIVEISTRTSHLRQVFVDGEPVSPLMVEGHFPVDGPYVRFCFRTSKYLPPSDELTLVQLVQAYRFWVKRRKVQGLSDFRSTQRTRAFPAEIDMRIRIQRL